MTLFSNTYTECSSLKVTDYISQPYIVIGPLVLTFPMEVLAIYLTIPPASESKLNLSPPMNQSRFWQVHSPPC